MTEASQSAAEFASRHERELRRAYARRPKKIADVLAQLITRKGYGRVAGNAALEEAWRTAAGESLARASRPGPIRRGRLEVTVTNSTTIQEFSFAKGRILAQLDKLIPDARIRDLRFRVGPIQ
jgi:hypothetical protein